MFVCCELFVHRYHLWGGGHGWFPFMQNVVVRHVRPQARCIYVLCTLTFWCTYFTLITMHNGEMLPVFSKLNTTQQNKKHNKQNNNKTNTLQNKTTIKTTDLGSTARSKDNLLMHRIIRQPLACSFLSSEWNEVFCLWCFCLFVFCFYQHINFFLLFQWRGLC